MAINEKHCTPCEGGTPPLKEQDEDKLMNEIEEWELNREGTHTLQKKFTFDNFKEAMEFVKKVADLANEENHHPDMHISYNKVIIELTTHKIDGLSENDFILASKIDNLQTQPTGAS
ncbi:MAG: 4a-hydroxytetrahydrobiopterin dehydratase [Chitinivibrionales bacterium]|nr:4a-hydroxytetrahydrobiopterin dehydratase [Chitinivibrionales bacterium]